MSGRKKISLIIAILLAVAVIVAMIVFTLKAYENDGEKESESTLTFVESESEQNSQSKEESQSGALASEVESDIVIEGSQAVFSASEPNDDGVFKLTVKFYNVSFNAYQYCIRYDTTKIAPCDKLTGAKAERFGAFASVTDEEWNSPISNTLDSEKGLIDFSGYVTPGVDFPGIEENGNITCGNEGLYIIEFTFKIIKEGSCGIEIAKSGSEKPYNLSIPEGGGIASEGEWIIAGVEFLIPEAIK